MDGHKGHKSLTTMAALGLLSDFTIHDMVPGGHIGTGRVRINHIGMSRREAKQRRRNRRRNKLARASRRINRKRRA